MPDVSKVILNGTTLMDVTDKTVDEDNLLYGETAVKNDGSTVTGAVVTAPASSTDPEMDGTASAGSANTYSRGDHVHPTDTSRQAKITASGILKGNGSGGVSAAVAGTDYISSESDPTVPSWAKASNKPTYTASEVGAQPEITANGILKANGSGTVTAAVAGTDYISSESDPTVPSWAKASNKPTYTASEVGAIPSTDKGAASGVAPLNASSKIDATYLPSYVDDVIEGYYNSTDGKFYEESTYTTEITAEAGKIYIDKSTNKEYRWGGSAYAEMPKGSTVTVTTNLSSGTKVGTINIDGTNYDLYAPTDTDTKVTQTKATYSSYTYWRGIPCGALSSSTATGAFSTSATTDREYTFDNLRFQPSTGILRARAFNPAPTVANTTASDNNMSSDSANNIYFRVNNGTDTVMTLYSNGTDMQVRPGGQYDNQVDLGKSTVKWKDLYLSGTIYGGSNTTTVASGDKILVHDTSAGTIAGGITLGSETTKYLANDGSWQNVPSGGATDFADLDDVFIATVDVTTHAQVLAAYTAGKIIFATDDSCKIFVPLVKYYTDEGGFAGNGSFYFSNIAYGMSTVGPRQMLMELDITDTWTSSDYDLATTGMIPSEPYWTGTYGTSTFTDINTQYTSGSKVIRIKYNDEFLYLLRKLTDFDSLDHDCFMFKGERHIAFVHDATPFTSQNWAVASCNDGIVILAQIGSSQTANAQLCSAWVTAIQAACAVQLSVAIVEYTDLTQVIDDIQYDYISADSTTYILAGSNADNDPNEPAAPSEYYFVALMSDGSYKKITLTSSTMTRSTGYLKPKTVVGGVTITTGNWNSSTMQCSKTVVGINGNSIVQVSPTPGSIDVAAAAGVYCSAQGLNGLTFTCKKIPTASITMNVMFW